MTPEAMAALHKRCFTIPRPWTVTEFSRMTTQFATKFHSSSHGFLLGRVLLEDAEILTLAVDPNHRRKGVARGLLDQFLSDVQSSGAQRAFLDVLHSNEAAKSLYFEAGFEQVHRRKGYFRAPDGSKHDGLVLHRTLP